MQRVMFVGALGAVLLSMGVVRQSSVDERLKSLEQARRVVPAHEIALRQELTDLVRELDILRSEVVASGSQEVLMEVRLEAVDAALGDAIELLSLQDERIGAVGQHVATLREAAATQDRLSALEQGVEARWSGLTEAIEATSLMVEDTRAQMESASPSAMERWGRTLGPTVQLAGDTTVGSGVLLQSREMEGGGFETLLLTCWHVVRDIQADGRGPDGTIPVAVYAREGQIQNMQATVVGADVDLDACLLRLVSDAAVEHGAWLPDRSRLAAAQVYDPVVAVGCPLGNDPIPTFGTLSDLRHRVDENRFWMISAPTYIGNSGGGIFGSNDHVLLGIFSKIYTHGSLRPVIVPHMGLVTPLAEIYDWLESSGTAQVLEAGDGRAVIRIDHK